MKSLLLFTVLLLPQQSKEDKTRIFVTESTERIEIIVEVAKKCPESTTVTLDLEKADFLIFLRDYGYPPTRVDTHVAVFDGKGDLIHSGSTRSIDTAVKDSCEAIRGILAERKSEG